MSEGREIILSSIEPLQNRSHNPSESWSTCHTFQKILPREIPDGLPSWIKFKHSILHTCTEAVTNTWNQLEETWRITSNKPLKSGVEENKGYSSSINSPRIYLKHPGVETNGSKQMRHFLWPTLILPRQPKTFTFLKMVKARKEFRDWSSVFESEKYFILFKTPCLHCR